MVRVVNMSDVGGEGGHVQWIDTLNHMASHIPDGAPPELEKPMPPSRSRRSRKRYTDEEEKALHRKQDAKRKR